MTSEEEEENLESQRDEVEALSAIYGDDFVAPDYVPEGDNNSGGEMYDIHISCDEEKWWAVTISIILPPSYPSSNPPIFQIHTECLSEGELNSVYQQLDELWEENKGMNVLYIWVEHIRTFLTEKYDMANQLLQTSQEEKERERALTELMRQADEEEYSTYETDTAVAVNTTTNQCGCADSEPVPHIISGETTTVKKSTFQGHVAIVTTMKEVKSVLRKLKENRKVAQATHNILAYRLHGVKEGSYIQDYADDGEVNAGGRLLHLLQIMDVVNIVVVVSRWFGGILLGPDRFRLINNAAREVVVGSGVYVPKQEKGKQKKKR